MDTRNIKKCHSFPRQLSARVTVLGTGAFPVYLVRGDRSSALIEAGIAATAGEVCSQLGRLGVKPDFLVVTHPHADHVTGLGPIREQFPAIGVVAGEGAAEFLSHSRSVATILAEDSHMASWMAGRGYPAGRPVAEAPSLEGALIVGDGRELGLGGVTLRFLAVRGHAPGNVVVYLPEERVLLAADCLGFYYPAGGGGGAFFPVFFTGYGAYMAALEGLHALRPEILGLGHHGIMRGAEVEGAFRLARRGASGLRERLCGDPRDEQTVVSELFCEFYRDELTLYSRENILQCCRLLLRRSREEVDDAR